MIGLMISYEIDPSSGCVNVEQVLDIRPISYDENGSYALPERLKAVYPRRSLSNGQSSESDIRPLKIDPRNYFVRQLGVVPKGDKALIYIQSPGIYIPDFGYGPVTNKTTIKKRQEKVSGDHERFPNLPKFREVYERELTEDGMRHVSKETFDTLCSYLEGHVELNEHDINKYMKKDDFYRGLVSIFENAGFTQNLPVPTVV